MGRGTEDDESSRAGPDEGIDQDDRDTPAPYRLRTAPIPVPGAGESQERGVASRLPDGRFSSG